MIKKYCTFLILLLTNFCYSQTAINTFSASKEKFYSIFLKEKKYSLDEYYKLGFGEFYKEQYYASKKYLSGKSLFYVQSEILIEALEDGYQPFITEQLLDFNKLNTYPEFFDKINKTIDKISVFDKGKSAIDFSLTDTTGNIISLHQFKGKVIYIDFWASWCMPCRDIIINSKKNIDSLKDKDVVFIYISLDKNINHWKKAIQQLGITGVNLIDTHGIDSKIANDYIIKHIPKTFIIDKELRFAYFNSMDAANPKFIEAINQLLKKSN